jgi:hypothetical protein
LPHRPHGLQPSAPHSLIPTISICRFEISLMHWRLRDSVVRRYTSITITALRGSFGVSGHFPSHPRLGRAEGSNDPGPIYSVCFRPGGFIHSIWVAVGKGFTYTYCWAFSVRVRSKRSSDDPGNAPGNGGNGVSVGIGWGLIFNPHLTWIVLVLLCFRIPVSQLRE